MLSANVEKIEENWYAIEMIVQAKSGTLKKLTGEVEFHIHSSFARPKVKITARNGRAVLKREAYGAFTVGAVVTADGTELELDLAELKDAPKRFREQ